MKPLLQLLVISALAVATNAQNNDADTVFTAATRLEVTTWFFRTFSVVFAAIALAVIVLTIKWRHLQPLKARRPLLLLVGHAALLVYIACMGVQVLCVECRPCFAPLVAYWPAALVALNVHLFRAWLLCFDYTSTRDRNTLLPTDFDDADSFIEVKTTWHLKHRRFARTRFLLELLAGKTLLESLPIWVPIILDASRFYAEPLNCALTDVMVFGFLAVVLFDFFLYLVAAGRFRQVQEAFYLKSELRILGIWGFLGAAAWVAFHFLDVDRLSPIDPKMLVLTAVAFGILIITGVFPLYKTYKMRQMWKQHSHKNGTDNDESLLVYLEHPLGREEFRRHVNLEFGAENLLFWETIENFHATMGNPANAKKPLCDHAAPMIRGIIDRFLREGSPCEIDVGVDLKGDAVARLNVLELYAARQPHVTARGYDELDGDAIGGPSPMLADFFNVAHSRVYQLISAETFVRFKQRFARSSLREKLYLPREMLTVNKPVIVEVDAIVTDTDPTTSDSCSDGGCYTNSSSGAINDNVSVASEGVDEYASIEEVVGGEIDSSELSLSSSSSFTNDRFKDNESVGSAAAFIGYISIAEVESDSATETWSDFGSEEGSDAQPKSLGRGGVNLLEMTRAVSPFNRSGAKPSYGRIFEEALSNEEEASMEWSVRDGTEAVDTNAPVEGTGHQSTRNAAHVLRFGQKASYGRIYEEALTKEEELLSDEDEEVPHNSARKRTASSMVGAHHGRRPTAEQRHQPLELQPPPFELANISPSPPPERRTMPSRTRTHRRGTNLLGHEDIGRKLFRPTPSPAFRSRHRRAMNIMLIEDALASVRLRADPPDDSFMHFEKKISSGTHLRMTSGPVSPLHRRGVNPINFEDILVQLV